MSKLLIAAALLAATAVGAASPNLPLAPVFPAGKAVDTIHRVQVRDPYRGLENSADPKVQAWSDAENARTRAYLDALPGRDAIAAKIRRIVTSTSPFWGGLQARGNAVIASYHDPAKQQPSIVVMDANADPKSMRTLLDPNVLDPSGHTAIDWFVASPDGTKVGVSLSKNGSEDGTLHIYDVMTGKEIEQPIDRVQYPTGGGAMAWSADGNSFWYTRYPGAEVPESERHFNMMLFLHKIGTPVSSDRLVLSARNGIPRTGEIFLDGNRGGAAALASVQLGDGGQWQHYVLEPNGSAIQIGHYADRVIGGAVIANDGTVYGVSRKDAPMGKVVKLAAPYTGGLAAARVIVPEEKNAAIIDGGEFGGALAITENRLAVTRIEGGPNVVTLYDLDSGNPRKLPLPDIAGVGEIDPLPDGDLLYSALTYLEPPYFMRWHAAMGTSSRTALAMTSPVSYADATVTRFFATSKDGTKVPVTIIARNGVKLDGRNPVLLYGYGGFGINLTPGFNGSFRRIWLDAGGIYAIANIRGGGEYGERWHQQGMLTHKQNVFDDFAAAAQELEKRGYTSHAKLAFMGGSNGGLLMGAEITQHPTLPRAVVSAVGIYDMIRSELDPNGAFNITEYGDIKDPAQFRAIYAYSPYHHVVKGTPYPAVLMLEGANDGRVNPMQSRKFAAALQAATSSGLPILLRVSKSSGHGIGNSLDEQIAETTDELSFLIDQLGMDSAAAGR